MERDSLLVGTVARAHGNRGQVIVNPETDFAEERFTVGATLLIGPEERPVRIAEVRFHQGRPVVGLEGVDTMTAAESLAGAELKMPVEALGKLPAGTYYRHDLVGCRVQDTDGRMIGEVAAVEGTLEASRLVVNAPHGEVLIPLVADICVEVDTGARRIRVAAPEGLIELNATVQHGPRRNTVQDGGTRATEQQGSTPATVQHGSTPATVQHGSTRSEE